jgi:hypothetical protein
MKLKNLASGLILLILMSGCAYQKPSSFKPIDSQSVNAVKGAKWSICRNGAFADKDGIRIYFNGEYATEIPIVVPGFNRRVDVVDTTNSQVIELKRIDPRNPEQDFSLTKITRMQVSEQNVYIIIDSNSTGGWVIPLPFLVMSNITGNRSIKAVTKEDFEKFCGNTSYKIFIKQ